VRYYPLASFVFVQVPVGSGGKDVQQIYKLFCRCISTNTSLAVFTALVWAMTLVQGEAKGAGDVPFGGEAATDIPVSAVQQIPAPAAAQNTKQDTLPGSLQLIPIGQLDSLAPPPKFFGSTSDFLMSADSLTASVDYSAEDSMSVDFVTKEIHLYGDATVDYEQISLKANHIVLNYGTNIVFAEPLPDSLGRPSGNPEFSDGGQNFVAKEMRYNFKTSKGIVYGTTTIQEDIYIRGGKSKFISGAFRVDDTTRADVIYTEGAIFTTCSAEHPHFGIRTRRAKVVPNKLAVIGASNLEIMGIPTPLWLPFGFFPLKSGRSSGLLFPADYQYSPQWGYGLQGIGWFFPLGENVNLQLTTDYYVKGTFTLNTNVRYVRRYKYSGSFNASYKRLRREDENLNELFDKGISINWSHRQDGRAHPTFTFGGSLNFQTNLVDQRFINSFEVASQNVIRSSMNATKTFPKLKSTLTFGLNHTQSNRTREITVNFPDANFTTQTIYPLRELPGRQKAWWKKLSFRYKSAMKTAFSAPDSTFFSQATLDDGQYGFRHDISSGVSLNVLKYFNISPNINFAETYYGKYRDYGLDGNIQTQEIIDDFGNVTIDTTSLGSITDELTPGLASYRTFSAGVSLSTQLFGKVRFKKKGLFGLQGLRHVMKPSVSLGYSPDYLSASDYISGEPYYIPENEIDSLNGADDRFLSPFANQIFGAPPSSEQNLGISYSIANLFEAKTWNKKDSTSQNIKLFQNIGVSGNYDFNRDTLQFSTVRISGGTQFFKGVTRVNFSATMDPYITRYDPIKDDYRRVNVSNLSEGRGLLSLTRMTSTISTNITVQKIRELFQGEEEEVVTDVNEERRKRREEETTLFEETDLLSLFERFSIRHTFNFAFDREFDEENPNVEDRGTPTFRQVANSIELRGDLQLTNNWRVGIGQIGYDFTSKRITYPYLTFTRDLHCWEMNFAWAPQRNTYSFSIAVKPGTLDFINLPVNQNRYDRGRLFAN
jgi:hypothetical protein